MDAAAPDVSVVIPTRNRSPLVGRAIDSVLDQRGVNPEVIVVDDGSVDDTWARLRAINNPRVVAVRNRRSTGLAAARNRGIAAARAPWLAFLDDDDVWAPTKLRQQLDALRDTGSDWAYCSAVLVDEHYIPLQVLEAPIPTGLEQSLRTRNVIPASGSNPIARTALVRDLGSFDHRLPHVADWDLWLSLAETAAAAVCHDVLIGYVAHRLNMSRVTPAPWEEFEILICKHGLNRDEARRVDLLTTRWRGYGFRSDHMRRKAAATYLAAARRNRDIGMLARGCLVLLGDPVLRWPRRRVDERCHEIEWLRALRASQLGSVSS
jgi:glycosyltransferase involved in cell wall biosynthesis